LKVSDLKLLLLLLEVLALERMAAVSGAPVVNLRRRRGRLDGRQAG
jgi:hypothetical protein